MGLGVDFGGAEADKIEDFKLRIYTDLKTKDIFATEEKENAEILKYGLKI